MSVPEPVPGPAPAAAARLRSLLDELGVEPMIHAGGTKSSMGGSRVPAEVGDVMRAALDVYVPMEELLAAVGDATARLLDADAAAVVAGAASGCVLAAAALREAAPAGRDVVVTQRRHYGRYTYLYEQAGCRVREVGTMNDCPLTEYEAALDERTAGVAWLEGPGISTAGATLAEVCALAAARGVPVLVDAAAMAFPTGNLHDYLRAGADLVVVSGGKLVQGPQASGFVLGRADLVDRIRRLGFPHQGPGRAHKVPKEVAVGAYAAMKSFVALDAAATATAVRTRAERIAALLAARGVPAGVEHNGRHALPAVVLPGVGAATGVPPSVLSARLLAGRPRIFVPYNDPRDEVYVEFASLDPAHDATVAERLAEVLAGAQERPDLAVVDVLGSSR